MRTADFNMVYWEVMGKVMNLFSEMFRIWVTKQVSHFNGTNRQLAWMDRTRTVKNVCPNCGCRDESPSHITGCWDPGCSSVFEESVDCIVAWMKDQQTGPNLVGVIQSYLIARGDQNSGLVSPTGLTSADSSPFPRPSGMGHFVEGRICALWVEMQAQEYTLQV